MKALEITSIDNGLKLIIELTQDEWLLAVDGSFWNFENCRQSIEKRLDTVILGKFNIDALIDGDIRKVFH